MTFEEYIDKAEHLIGAYRVGALTQDELKYALAQAEIDINPEDDITSIKLEILFDKPLEDNQ